MPALSAAEGTAVELRFAEAPGVTDLVFGGDQGWEVIPLDATLVITLPALAFAAQVIPNAKFALVIALPAFNMEAEARLPGRLVRSRRAVSSGFESTLRVASGPRQHHYGDALRRRTGSVFAFVNAERRVEQRQRLPHQDGLRERRREVAARYAEALRYPAVRFFERIPTVCAP